MIVIDASAMVDFMVGADARADAVRNVVSGQNLTAPYIIDLECIAALRGLVRGGKLPEIEGEHALALFRSMPIRRSAHTPLMDRIWQLRHNMGPYDASYVALAEVLETELVTIDNKFESVPGLHCPIHVVSS